MPMRSRMRESLTYLYSSGSGRYWFAVQPNLNRTVADRASKLDNADVWAELEQRMRLWRAGAGVDFAGVHIAPARPDDVPDEDRARLVVLSPRVGHKKANEESQAITLARAMLESRGASPRRYRNMLLFLAADADALDTLTAETRRYLAWKSVQKDTAELGLDSAQEKQCAEAISSGEKTVALQLENVYQWLIVTAQTEPVLPASTPLPLEAVRLSNNNDFGAAGTVLQRASYRATTDNHLITRWGPNVLMMELNRYNLWQDAPQMGVRQLWQYLATYLYLPRLRDRDVLLATIRAGAATTDFFAYAMSADAQGHYQGLYFGRQPATVFDEEGSLIVKGEAARTALAQQTETGGETTATGVGSATEDAGALWQTSTASGKGSGRATTSAPISTKGPTTFFGSVTLDPLQLTKDAGQVGQAVIQHLASQFGAVVKVRLEIEAQIPGDLRQSGARRHGERQDLEI